MSFRKAGGSNVKRAKHKYPRFFVPKPSSKQWINLNYVVFYSPNGIGTYVGKSGNKYKSDIGIKKVILEKQEITIEEAALM